MPQTLQIKHDIRSLPFKVQALRMVLLALQFTVGWAVLSLFPWFRQSHRTYLENLLVGLLFGIFCAFFFTLATSGFRRYELRITDDSLTANYGYFQRTIRRDALRTVTEVQGSLLRPAALLLSKHGPFGTRMWGCIWIPRECAEYEQLRDLALCWKQPPG